MSHYPRLDHLAVSNEGFVFDPSSGDSFQVSEIGLVILTALRAGRTADAIAQALTEKYDVSLADAQHDVADFQASLGNHGLL